MEIDGRCEESRRSGPGSLITPRRTAEVRARWVVLVGALLLLLLVGWGAGELVTSSLTREDLAVVRDVAAWRNSVATSVAQVVSWGGNAVVIGPAAALACLAVYRRDLRGAAVVGLSTLGAALIFNVDKLLIGRPRPPVSRLAPAVHSSFPSGHATLSAAFYLALLIVFLSRRRPRITTIVSASAATLTILAIGFARVYLGVHYLSDVVAGVLLGAVWAIVVGVALGSG
jgi:undecaprenyl-diphosphatase